MFKMDHQHPALTTFRGLFRVRQPLLLSDIIFIFFCGAEVTKTIANIGGAGLRCVTDQSETDFFFFY